MADPIQRDIGTMDPALLSDSQSRQHVFDFFKLELPEVDETHEALTFRFAQVTKLPSGWLGDLDGTNQVWSPYDWVPEGLSNTNDSILEISAVSLGNIKGTWTGYDIGYNLQGRRVTIWRAQFEVDDTTLKGKTILFQGKTDEISCKDRARMTLIPFRSAFDVQIPSATYERDLCMHLRNYKGPFCQYVGDMPSCSGQLEGANGCRAHDNIIHFGAFPAMRKRGESVVWGPPEAPQHFPL